MPVRVAVSMNEEPSLDIFASIPFFGRAMFTKSPDTANWAA